MKRLPHAVLSCPGQEPGPLGFQPGRRLGCCAPPTHAASTQRDCQQEECASRPVSEPARALCCYPSCGGDGTARSQPGLPQLWLLCPRLPQAAHFTVQLGQDPGLHRVGWQGAPSRGGDTAGGVARAWLGGSLVSAPWSVPNLPKHRAGLVSTLAVSQPVVLPAKRASPGMAEAPRRGASEPWQSHRQVWTAKGRKVTLQRKRRKSPGTAWNGSPSEERAAQGAGSLSLAEPLLLTW